MGAEISAPFRAAIITLSDKGADGKREDKSGPLIRQTLTDAGFTITEQLLLSDDAQPLTAALIRIADEGETDIIFTTGGTGFSPRDHAPEATLAAVERPVPGIAEAMRMESLRITKRAMLSRAVSGIRKRTLIINLPGSPKAVGEMLSYLLDTLPHGLEILRGEASECARP